MRTDKRFYELIYGGSDDDNLMVAERYQMTGFDHTRLWEGKPLRKPIPPRVRFFVDLRKKRTDYVPNVASWPICSQRFVDLLLPAAKDDIELFDAPLFDVRTRNPVPGYKIMNVISLIECLDMQRSTTTIRGSIIKPVFRASKIPEAVRIFRPAENHFDVMFSAFMVDQLRGKGLTGLAFITRYST